MDTQIQRLFDEKHRLTGKQLDRLDPRHQRQLVRMVKGTMAAPDRTVAMDALVRLAPASARRALSEVILDDETPLHLRAAAATQLGRIGGAAAEAKLIDSLAAEKAPIFQIKVAAALGKMGTPKSVTTLKRMTRPRQTRALRRQAQLSLVLIGFRYNDQTYAPPIPKTDQLLPPREAFSVTFNAEPVRRSLLTAVLDDTRLDSYGIELSTRTGIQFDCGRNRFVMLLNASIADRDILAELKRPMVIGLVAQQAPTDASWATRYVLLAWPGRGGRCHLCGYRTDGFQVLSGSIEPDDSGGVVEMTAVRDGANTPAQLKGHLRGKKISFTSLLTEERVVGKHRLKERGVPVSH